MRVDSLIKNSSLYFDRELATVHATVLHGDSVEFGAYMYTREWRLSRRVDMKERSCSFL